MIRQHSYDAQCRRKMYTRTHTHTHAHTHAVRSTPLDRHFSLILFSTLGQISVTEERCQRLLSVSDVGFDYGH